MSNGQIIRLIPYGASQVTGDSTDGVNTNFPAVNLADPQPKTVFRSLAAVAAGGKIHSIYVDLGADTPIDTVAAMFMDLDQSGLIYVYATTSASGGFSTAIGARVYAGDFAPSGITRESRQFALAQFTSVSRRYIVVQLVIARAIGETMQIGICALGQRIAQASNFELGSGRKVEDQSIVRTLPGGETAIERGGRTPLWRATWSNLSESELANIWSLLVEIGTSAPVLLIEDPDRTTGLSERMHYGLLTSLDFTERVQFDKQRIDITIREMV